MGPLYPQDVSITRAPWTRGAKKTQVTILPLTTASSHHPPIESLAHRTRRFSSTVSSATQGLCATFGVCRIRSRRLHPRVKRPCVRDRPRVTSQTCRSGTPRPISLVHIYLFSTPTLSQRDVSLSLLLSRGALEAHDQSNVGRGALSHYQTTVLRWSIQHGWRVFYEGHPVHRKGSIEKQCHPSSTQIVVSKLTSHFPTQALCQSLHHSR